MPEIATLPAVEELITLHQAVARSGGRWTRYQLERAILRGQLSAVRSGDRIMIPVHRLEQFIATHGDSPRRSA